MEFSQPELRRYLRHFALPDFGLRGQQRLRDGSALVVGAGGLGCPMLQYLVAAGVGRIGIADGDRVDESNLHRQILYTLADVGRLKAEVARERLNALNPHVQIDVYPERLTRHNALEITGKYDVVADGTDNFPTRYLLNDACVLSGKPHVWAALFRYEAQLSVFNLLQPDGLRGPTYRDLFPTPPAPGSAPDCAEAGVLGVLPGIVGAMQANEAIKILSGVGEVMGGRLWLFDSGTGESRVVKLVKRPELQVVRELIDYEAFCEAKKLE